MEFTQVVENRYSCKNFSGRKVEAEKLQVILEAGRVAPTAKNLQEQRVYVVQSEEGLKKIDAVTPRREAGFRRGGCLYCSHAHDAGRRQRRSGQLLAELL